MGSEVASIVSSSVCGSSDHHYPSDVSGGFRTNHRHLQAMWGACPSDVWAGAELGLVNNVPMGAMWHFDGRSWSAIDIPNTPDPGRILAVHGTGPDGVWVGGDAGVLYQHG